MTWTPTNAVAPWADYLRVKIGGEDVTFFRNQVTIPTNWQQTDPYGPMSATVVLPQVTSFDDIDGDPDLAWLYEGAQVRFDPIADGAVVDPKDPPFYGIVDSIEQGDGATILECSGNFNGRMSTLMHQPHYISPGARDGGAVLWDEIDGSTHYKMLPHGGPTTGIKVSSQGSRDMTRLGYIDNVLGLMIGEGGGSWTLLPDRARGPKYLRCQQRSMAGAADLTVYNGAHGVKIRTKRDRVDMVTGVFGSGVAPSGERWNNLVAPLIGDGIVPDFSGTLSLGDTDATSTPANRVTVLARRLWALNLLSADDDTSHTFTDEVEDAVKRFQKRLGMDRTGVVTASLWRKIFGADFTEQSWRQAHYEELASDPRTEYWLRGPDGTPVDLNPVFDRTVTKNEIFQGYGENVTKRQAEKNAQAIIDRAGARVGTIVLTSDPAERSRFDIRPGDTIHAAYYLGAAGTKFYVSSVQVDWADSRQPVTLAVSTTAKHYLELATIIQRRMEARQDPGKQWRHQLRRSAQVADSSGGWEGEAGAGIVQETKVNGGHWNVIQVPAAQFGVISDLRLVTDSPTELWASVHATEVHGPVFDSVLGDPSTWRGTGADKLNTFAAHHDWLVQNERLMIEAWGDPDQPGGYAPLTKTGPNGATTHPLTGVLRDRGSWDFATARGFLYLAVWVKNDCTIHGRLKFQRTGEGA